MDLSLHVEIAPDALQMATLPQRPAVASSKIRAAVQFAAETYCAPLVRSGTTPLMTCKGDCWDNAPMESFFHALKIERVHHRIYDSCDHARRDLLSYIEGFYKARRLHSDMGYVSPTDAERRAAFGPCVLSPGLLRAEGACAGWCGIPSYRSLTQDARLSDPGGAALQHQFSLARALVQVTACHRVIPKC